MSLPGSYTRHNPLPDAAFLIDGEGKKAGSDVVIASGQTFSGTPTHIVPPGTVVVKKTGDGKYYKANDASDGDRDAAPAAITSSSHSDGNGVIKLVGNHGTISVTTATGSGTEDNHVTDLNADAEFSAHYVASAAANELVITALGVGEREWFYIHSDTIATVGFAEGVANEVKGTDADYRVTNSVGALLDTEGSAQDDLVGTLLAGKFLASAIETGTLTGEAKAALIRQGSHFE